MGNDFTRRATEELARRITRRQILRRAASTTFATLAVIAVDGFRSARTSAATCYYTDPGHCGCRPPNGTYCISLPGGGSNCNGADCAGNCKPSACGGDYPVDRNCWCTDVCCYGPGSAGYYICCDCLCPDSECCACSQFVSTGGNCFPGMQKAKDSKQPESPKIAA